MLRALMGVVGVALLIVVGGLIGLWVYAHLIFGLTLTHQPGLVRFPPNMQAYAMAKNKVKIALNGYIEAAVPFKQTLSLPLHGDYDTDIRFDIVAPVEFTIRYQGTIPVNSMADIHGVTDFNYEKVKRLRNVAFSARLPLKFEQPISLTVPVKANLHLIYHGPLKVAFNQTISAPVDTVLHTRLLAQRDITTPILARFGLNVHWPQTPIPIIIEHSDLRLRLNTLRLEKSESAAEPAKAAAPVNNIDGT